MTPPPDLAIIIVSYNVCELLAGCLESVFAGLTKSPGLQASVIVVDNASADGSAAMVAGRFPQARLLASQENLGFAGGNNLALQALGFRPAGAEAMPRAEIAPGRLASADRPARPRHVLLLNPDTVVEGHALLELVSFLDGKLQAGACGAQLAHPDGRFQHAAFRFPGLWQIAFDFFPPPGRLNQPVLDSRWNGRYSRRLYAGSHPFPVDFVLGAALMVRAEAIEQVGLLDEGYFMYCEEMDWQQRLHRAGWAVYCLPAARVLHYGGASTSQFRGPMVVALWRSRLRYFQRYHGRSFNWLARKLIGQGAAVEARRARRLQPPDLAQRLAAFDQVRRLSQD